MATAKHIVMLITVGIWAEVVSSAQTPVLTVNLAEDDVAVVRTALGITTRLVFSEEVREIVCGDLFDPESGRGGFVIQQIGNDVYLKPVIPKGTSNLFVKTGAGQLFTFNFDLTIGKVDDAYRIVNVTRAMRPGETVASNVSRKPGAPSPPNLELLDFCESVLPQQRVDGVTFTLALEPRPNPPAPSVAVLSQRESKTPQADVQSLSDESSERGVINKVVPEYPLLARAARVTGVVVVEVEIAETGRVTAARALSGPSLLTGPAINAAMSWLFAPLPAASGSRKDIIRISFRFERN
jgi:TonB family protein